ncbi:hypothetical protein KDW_42320 [Dictyobacter vulcani]|uniref:Bacterial transcriptional activator domain-containing protein n=1 Tax=Dictyobacter vulcani TaxID=2607529 RepID=A0A5J4KUC1_9CHLR|nr:BTAD domain-containing putative transcriptional regulator [Dictyobacter vulcani]GER90070.1 hypothetical protein KDW_42320 [Dictyobacter vulcani]
MDDGRSGGHEWSEPRSPIARIWLCGAFVVEWIDPGTGQACSTLEMSGAGRDYTSALSLLKLLLSQPQRRAHRDWIMEQFWPASGRHTAAHRLENIFSVLRKLMCHPLTGECLLRSFRAGKENGMMYQLEASPLVWLDVDAQVWNVEQAARMERFGDDAQPFWERAYELGKRGPFLSDERYVDWATQRRNEVEGYYRQTIHALASLYLARYGSAGASEALLLLRTYWQQYPKDEDALRLLMDVLSAQERYQEALEYYDHLCQLLQEEQTQPDERTKDSAEYCKAKQIQRSRPGALWLTPRDREPECTLLEGPSQNMDNTRRETIAGLIGLVGMSALSTQRKEVLTQAHAASLKQEDLAYFHELIEGGWELCNVGEWQVAEHVLDSFLSDAIRRAPKQRDFAYLATKGLVLKSILQAHQLNITVMPALCRQAVLYARQTRDHTALGMALNGLAVAFKYNHDYKASLNTYQEALSFCDEQASPLIRSRIYAGAAAAFARIGKGQEADRCINQAYECFPNDPMQEAYPLSADHGRYMLSYYHGLMYLALQQPAKAYPVFEQYQYVRSSSVVPGRNRLEILNQQGKAAVLSNHLDEYVVCLQQGIEGAQQLGSKKRLDEVVEIYQKEVPGAWKQHQKIKQITEQHPFLLVGAK